MKLIHIQQQKELFIVLFYALYLYYWIKNLIVFRNSKVAYMMIPFEREAYEYERFEGLFAKQRKIPLEDTTENSKKENEKQIVEYCDVCGCYPCDCHWGSH